MRRIISINRNSVSTALDMTSLIIILIACHIERSRNALQQKTLNQMPTILSYLKSQTNLPESSIKNTLQLLEEDATIPFIARYRKERTGNLDEVQIGDIVKFKEQFETLEKRKATILKALEEQEVLTPELQKEIENTSDATVLEDLYLPYKKTRKTKADTARENGLKPLAKIIMAQNTRNIDGAASRFLILQNIFQK